MTGSQPITVFILKESRSASIDYNMVLFQCFVSSRHRIAIACSTALTVYIRNNVAKNLTNVHLEDKFY